MIIITNWNEILTSHISKGFREELQIFFKELVHDNMGEDHLTYDFTEIGKIAILESSDDLSHLPEIGFYSETMLLLDKIVEFVDDIWIDEMLPKKEVIQLYSHADVFCCPSIYEPFGIINIEAMACETAVVASAVGGITNMIIDGYNGILIAPDSVSLKEALVRLIKDSSLRNRLRINGYETAKHAFSITQWKERWTEVLSTVSQA